MTSQLHSRSRRWSFSGRRALSAFAISLPILLFASSLLGRPGYALVAFGDLSQLFLLATTSFFFAWKCISTRGTHSAFWLLIALGFGLWTTNMLLWTYYEVLQNQPVPSIPAGSFLLFIKLVPLIAALALEPNRAVAGRPRVLGILDLSSLLVYWTYVYLFWALAYRLVGNDFTRYNR
ncbi:MAG: hypothetical protein ACRD51_06750, partial [Candidatus Acidiferrum sp.]